MNTSGRRHVRLFSALTDACFREKYTLQRSKGLGENQPDMMNLTTMNPETRRLIKIMPEEAALTSEMFDLLLGDNLSGRKEYISENGHLYLEDADIS